MTINGISGASAGAPAGQPGMSKGSDPVSKELQDRIARAQKQLQELSANTELSAEAKAKKRQELQKQISDLNVQLRQHQIEQRKKEREEKASFDDMLGTKPQESKKNGKGQAAAVPSQASMEAMISADTAMSQAKVQGSVATKMEGRAGVLETEIMLDRGRSGSSNVELKEAELADVEQKAMDAASAQMSTLAEANKTMEEASKTDKSEEEKDGEKKTDENAQTANGTEGEAQAGITAPGAEKTQSEAAIEAGAPQIAPVVHYSPVDVRL